MSNDLLQSAALTGAAIVLTVLAAVCIYRVSPRQTLAPGRIARGLLLPVAGVALLLAGVLGAWAHGTAAGLVLVFSCLMMALILVPSWVVWTRRGG